MVYILAVLIILLDQFSKYLVKTYMQIGESIPLLGDVLRLTSHRNPGAAFGMLQGKRWLFVVITVIVISAIAYATGRIGKERKLLRISLGLLLGGAVGNLIDRVLHGEVVDFIDVHIIHYPIFNIADSAIVIAVVLMMIDMFIMWRKEEATQR
ncbi:lipoprotein signal peptidase [Collibacillus ludicampi]|jgi:signal peptidase II|uniref:Lipoprotein signal peptidase n=1 Tax=Collibacillus ludicampi TaxID=2771369 RepID=A0AAV4LJA8_9BACL|nr:signal peptidase II [Collibacillus ludicampi]GIM47499.1 lipoprotein signal peptidase [Collibacillus ludicampi]